MQSSLFGCCALSDPIGGDTHKRSWKTLKKGGILVSIVGPPSEEEAKKHGVRSAFLSAQGGSSLLAELATLVDSGKIKPMVEKVLPLPEARKAHELNETGHARGKIVLKSPTMIRQIAEFIAVLACSLFAGAAVYVSLVEHPARMACGVEIATAEFPPSYRRGTIMQVTLAAVCLLSSIAAWLAGATFWWVLAGVLQVSVIPFTLIVILPTNKQLLNPALDRRSPQTGKLLARWGRLHVVRRHSVDWSLLLFLCLLTFAKSR